MVSAILMAGYKNKMEVRRYSKTVAEHYGEKFIETGYRPLREFNTVKDGKEEKMPIIQFTLEKLFASDRIDEIIIVGHQMLLERRLGQFIKKFAKLKPRESKKLRKKIEELDLMRVKTEHVAKIIDLMPEEQEELNKIFVDVSLNEDETKKILETVKEFK